MRKNYKIASTTMQEHIIIIISSMEQNKTSISVYTWQTPFNHYTLPIKKNIDFILSNLIRKSFQRGDWKRLLLDYTLLSSIKSILDKFPCLRNSILFTH